MLFKSIKTSCNRFHLFPVNTYSGPNLFLLCPKSMKYFHSLLFDIVNLSCHWACKFALLCLQILIQCSLLQVLSTNRPTSKTNSFSISFNSVEEAKPGSVVGSVRLRDRESQEEGEVTYTVVGGTARDGTFVVDRLTGDVYLARPLDYERDARYTLQIEVDDLSQAPPSSTLVHLDIDIEDSNDHAPQFPEDPITIVISESMEAGSSVYTFQATDKDGSGPNSELKYSILHQWPNTPGLLTLNPSTGVLSLAQELDHEVTSNLILVVKATDSALDATQSRWGSVTARVYVTDENDNPPVFSSPTAVSVMEDQPVGFVVLYVMARDADQGENGRVTYNIQSGNTGGTFSLNPNTGKSSPVPIQKVMFASCCKAQMEGVEVWVVDGLVAQVTCLIPVCMLLKNNK